MDGEISIVHSFACALCTILKVAIFSIIMLFSIILTLLASSIYLGIIWQNLA